MSVMTSRNKRSRSRADDAECVAASGAESPSGDSASTSTGVNASPLHKSGADSFADDSAEKDASAAHSDALASV